MEYFYSQTIKIKWNWCWFYTVKPKALKTSALWSCGPSFWLSVNLTPCRTVTPRSLYTSFTPISPLTSSDFFTHCVSQCDWKRTRKFNVTLQYSGPAIHWCYLMQTIYLVLLFFWNVFSQQIHLRLIKNVSLNGFHWTSYSSNSHRDVFTTREQQL